MTGSCPLLFFTGHLCAQGLLPAAEEKQGCHVDVGRLFVFAVMWSLGALLELDDRAKMEAFLKVCVCVCLDISFFILCYCYFNSSK